MMTKIGLYVLGMTLGVIFALLVIYVVFSSLSKVFLS